MPVQILDGTALLADRDRAQHQWPKTPEDQARRLLPMCMPAFRPSFTLDRDMPIFTIGSCFARNVEKQLITSGYNVAARDFPAICETFGTVARSDALNKFVAPSIAQELRWALDPDAAFNPETIVDFGKDRCLDLQLASALLPRPRADVLKLREAINHYMRRASEAKVVIITLGLAEGWFDTQHGLYLNRAPLPRAAERYPGRFEVHVLSYEDIVASLEEIVSLLSRFGQSDVRILLSVSPVAMGRTWTDNDAFVGNTYSKSVQRAAATYLTTKYDHIDYLPTYESITLSDRRLAYQEDQAHVTDEAVRVNILRMLAAYTGDDLLADENGTVEAMLSLQQSQEAREAGDQAEALRHAWLAHELAPSDIKIAAFLGRLLVDAGDAASAEKILRPAHEAGGLRYRTGENLGRALLMLKRAKDAIPILEQSHADSPLHGSSLRLLASACFEDGQQERALALLTDAIGPGEARTPALVKLAIRFLGQMGRDEEAMDLVKRASSQHPDNQQLRTMRKNLRARLDQSSA